MKFSRIFLSVGLLISCSTPQTQYKHKGVKLQPETSKDHSIRKAKNHNDYKRILKELPPQNFYEYNAKVPANHTGYFYFYTYECTDGYESSGLRMYKEKLFSLKTRKRKTYYFYSYSFNFTKGDPKSEFCQLKNHGQAPKESIVIPPRNIKSYVTIYAPSEFIVMQSNKLASKKTHPLQTFECKCLIKRKVEEKTLSSDDYDYSYGKSKLSNRRIEFKARSTFQALKICSKHLGPLNSRTCLIQTPNEGNQVFLREYETYQNYDFKY